MTAKSAALVAASTFNAHAFLRLHQENPYTEIVAVDGGYAHLTEIHVAPTFALGDFDSLGFVPQGIPLATFPEEKDKSDLELALDWCALQGIHNVTVYGAFAQRLDHTLAALQAMASFALQTKSAVQGISETQHLVVLPPGVQLVIEKEAQTPSFCSLPKDERCVSVISLANESCGVSVLGMKYQLNGGELTNTCSLGLSNELVGNEVRIVCVSGCLLVILPLFQKCVFQSK